MENADSRRNEVCPSAAAASQVEGDRISANLLPGKISEVQLENLQFLGVGAGNMVKLVPLFAKRRNHAWVQVSHPIANIVTRFPPFSTCHQHRAAITKTPSSTLEI